MRKKMDDKRIDGFYLNEDHKDLDAEDEIKNIEDINVKKKKKKMGKQYNSVLDRLKENVKKVKN